MSKKGLSKKRYHIKKRHRKYRKFLQRNNLASKTFSYASAVDKKNILLKNMHFLIQILNLKSDHYIDNINIIRLLSTELYFLSNNSLDGETLIQLDETVEDILNHLNLVLINDNLEKEIIKDFRFLAKEVKKYFNYNRLYSIIATAFASPFILNENYYYYYRYAYYLSMYLNLHYYSNVETTNPDPRLFLVKLKVQAEMINAIKKITPENFNLLIIRTNKWINGINFKKLEKAGD